MKTTHFYLIIAIILFIGMNTLFFNNYRFIGLILGLISSVLCGYCIAKLTNKNHA